MIQIWMKTYSKKEDYIVLCEMPTWAYLLEEIASLFLRTATTWSLANRVLDFTDKKRNMIHKFPMPDELSEAWWREEKE